MGKFILSYSLLHKDKEQINIPNNPLELLTIVFKEATG